MFDSLQQQLLQQEVIYQQYRTDDGQAAGNQPAAAGAVRSATSTTLTVTVVAGMLNIELPQALGLTSNPTFNSINIVDDATTRGNLGLGALAVLNAAAASADTAPAQAAAYVQADAQAVLDELRDLKAKLRASGVLST